MKLGVRAGSLETMCSVFSSTVSAIRTKIGCGLELTYGSMEVRPPTSRSIWRSAGFVRSGWPLTQNAGAESRCTENVGVPAGSFVLML